MIKLVVAGRVGKDAELKSVGDTTVCSFSVAHTEKVYGQNTTEKTVWIACSVWGERAPKLAPYILKGTFVVVEGSGGVNAYMSNSEPVGVINCRVTSLEFGGKPTTDAVPVTNIAAVPPTPPTGKVAMEAVDGDLPF